MNFSNTIISDLRTRQIKLNSLQLILFGFLATTIIFFGYTGLTFA